VFRAISADPEKRYPSSEALGLELRAFLDGKRTQAEVHRWPSWSANATIEGPVPVYLPQPGTAKPLEKWAVIEKARTAFRSILWPLLAGLVIGPICFIPASHMRRYWADSAPLRASRDYRTMALPEIQKDWSLLQDLQRKFGYLGRFSPESYFGSSMEARLAAAGDQVLKRYENSTEPGIGQYDWERARFCFDRLASTGDNADEWKGKLAVASGFAQLTKEPAQSREAAANFHQAISLAPRLMAPHLGLAWIYVYDNHNPGMAQAEFQAAENVGHRLGAREKEQQADAYLSRAELELKQWRGARSDGDRKRYAGVLQRDFDRARSLYEPIAGYSRVSDSLERLEKDERGFQDAVARGRAAEAARRKSKYRPWR
jgi:hypothetical protein